MEGLTAFGFCVLTASGLTSSAFVSSSFLASGPTFLDVALSFMSWCCWDLGSMAELCLVSSMGCSRHALLLGRGSVSLLYETVPAFEDTWIECLGDLVVCTPVVGREGEDDDSDLFKTDHGYG